MAWFAVRTLYRTRLSGEPKRRDPAYIEGVAAIEERILIFEARSHAAAQELALREAKSYAKQISWKNVYGQRVSVRVLSLVRSYEIGPQPGNGDEVFSEVEVVRADESEKDFIKRKVGFLSGRETARMFKDPGTAFEKGTS